MNFISNFYSFLNNKYYKKDEINDMIFNNDFINDLTH